MNNIIIERLTEKLITKKSNIAYFTDRSYKPIEFNSRNFHIIDRSVKAEYANKRICFIDGGNIELIGNNNFSLSIARVYSSIWKDCKRIKTKTTEFYIFVDSVPSEKSISYNSSVYFEGKLLISENYDLTESDETIKPETIINNSRRILEISEIQNLLTELDKNDIICLDGTLKTKYENEKELFAKVSKEVNSKGIILASLCKTSSTLTDSGDNLLSSILQLANDSNILGCWYYDNICINENPSHAADLAIVRLHEKAEHVFMLEIDNKSSNMKMECILELAKYSRDPVFLGYPYGLIDADRNARCTKEMQTFLRTKLISKCKDQKKLMRIINTNKAHDILDHIR